MPLWPAVIAIPIVTLVYFYLLYRMHPYSTKVNVRVKIGGTGNSVEFDQPSVHIQEAFANHGVEPGPDLVAKFSEAKDELLDCDWQALKLMIGMILRDPRYGCLSQRSRTAQDLCFQYILIAQHRSCYEKPSHQIPILPPLGSRDLPNGLLIDMRSK